MKKKLWAATGAAVLAASAAQADPPLILFEFSQEIAGRAHNGAPPADYEIICVLPLDGRLPRGQTSLTILREAGQGGELVVMSGFPVTHPDELWTGLPTKREAPLDDDPSTPPTADWGWIYDRNGDGQNDWLAFFNGPIPVLPNIGYDEGYLAFGSPGTRPGEVSGLTRDELVTLLMNTRTVYRHIIDTDFDGTADTLISKPIADGSPWVEGKMVVLGHPDQGAERPCYWQSDADLDDVLSCTASKEGEYRTTGGDHDRVSFDFTRPVFFELFDLVANKSAECDFGSFGIEARP